MRDRDKPRESERCDFPELRVWYETIHHRLRADPKLSAGEIIASWARLARPLVMEVEGLTKSERRRHPGRYVRADGDRWFERHRDAPPGHDGPMAEEPDIKVAFDRSGAYIRSRGRVIRDREQALAAPDHVDWTRQLSIELLPSGREHGARKGAHGDTLTRALLLWSISRELGQRRAARCAIVWDGELGVGNTSPDVQDIVRRFQDLEALTPQERHRRRSAEATIISVSKRIWETIGLQPQVPLRI